MSDDATDGQRRDVVVVGASAGGVEALSAIAEGLPEDFGGAVFVVLHRSSGTASGLRQVLQRSSSLPVRVAQDGSEIATGTISVAPPDRHLLVEKGRIRVVRAPKANGYRPSIDVLFHSAAIAYGPRVAGVVLSGTLNDGTLGLRAIKRRRGVAVVQADALHQGMPTSAIENVDVDFVVPLREISERLTMLAANGVESMAEEERIAENELESGYDISELEEAPGEPSVFRCPECGGALWEHVDGTLSSFSCHVGHTYSADSLLDEQSDQVERAVWTAVRLLEERASLVKRLAERMERTGATRSRERFERRARLAEEQAALIRQALLDSDEDPDSDAAEDA